MEWLEKLWAESSRFRDVRSPVAHNASCAEDARGAGEDLGATACSFVTPKRRRAAEQNQGIFSVQILSFQECT